MTANSWRCLICGILLLCHRANASSADETDFLMNPVLTSQQAIQAAVEQYEIRLKQLEQRQRRGILTDEEERLKALVRLFIIFAGPGLDKKGEEPGRLELVDLAQTDDPAVTILRQRIRIPAPKGVVFVRTYSSLHVMPTDVLAAFTRENTQGVTILSRYIAMAKQTAADHAHQQFYDHRQAAILSHELVHAYINAALAEKPGHNLPVWFHEGCATYLSDSPGGKPVTQLLETPLGYRFVTFEDKAPWDYRQYKLVFNFLEARLGRSGLYGQIRQAVETGSIEALMAKMQVETPFVLMDKAEQWHRSRQILIYSLGTMVVLVLLLLIWSKLPKERKNIEPIV